ncbi:MAG: GNAT family N-acetyltransferase [Verrucomicrobiales bacterium]|nr:GNAT family N-acetyltransferase [Verrucomicrobiales bacterium]
MLAIRPMLPSDFNEVAELIYLSTNSWYQQKLGHPIFSCEPQDCRLFCEVYEELDPGCGFVLAHEETGLIVGSCFYHPRETHVSLGIMNVHPNYFGHGIAGKILREIISYAEARDLPIRLISSALNLDSYSLYNRHGFSPANLYQDMIISVPREGLSDEPSYELPAVREAEPSDLLAMGQLEFEISGISREKDYCYFLENTSGNWRTVVSIDENGEAAGFLVSIDNPASRLIGPGVARNEKTMEALLRAQLNHFAGQTVVFLLPADAGGLIAAAYQIGARNCELHLTQVRGISQPVNGIVMPTFMPETA